MKLIGKILMITGLGLIIYFGFEYVSIQREEAQSLESAERMLAESSEVKDTIDIKNYQPEQAASFALLEVPKLDKTLPVVEGTDPDMLDRGVGHMDMTALPGQGEQIILSGHRDTVFREFSKLGIGDEFVVQMEYGDYTYEVQDTEIVSADDTSVVGEMGEEVLVVSTCYPFSYLGNAPDRFVFYAYPVEE